MGQTADTRRATLRVGRNATARLAAQIAARLLSLVLVGLVARHEGAAGLGRYILVTTLVGLGAVITDLGLSMFLTREIAQEPVTSRQQLLLGDLLSLRVALATLGAGALVVLAWGAFFPVETRRLFSLGALALIPRAVARMLGAFFTGRRRMDITSSVDVITRGLTLTGSLPALAAGFGVPGVLACTAAADAVGVLLYGAVLRSWRFAPGFRFAPLEWRAALSEAYPFAITGIIAVAYRRLDVVLLSAWQGDTAAGQYGAAYTLWETVGLIPASLLDAMFPELALLAREPDGSRRLARILRRTGPALLAAGLLLSAVSTALAGRLVPLVYGRAEAENGAVVAFRLQVWAVPAMFLYLLNGHVLYAVRRQRWVTGAMAVVGIVNVGLNLIVIPQWSAPGVSVVALFSAWLLWALLALRVRRALSPEKETR